MMAATVLLLEHVPTVLKRFRRSCSGSVEDEGGVSRTNPAVREVRWSWRDEEVVGDVLCDVGCDHAGP